MISASVCTTYAFASADVRNVLVRTLPRRRTRYLSFRLVMLAMVLIEKGWHIYKIHHPSGFYKVIGVRLVHSYFKLLMLNIMLVPTARLELAQPKATTPSR